MGITGNGVVKIQTEYTNKVLSQHKARSTQVACCRGSAHPALVIAATLALPFGIPPPT